MNKYSVTVGVKSASGSQTFLIEAESEDEARIKLLAPGDVFLVRDTLQACGWKWGDDFFLRKVDGPTAGMTDEQQATLDSLLELERGLSKREADFVDDLDKQRNMPLLEAQATWLDDIYLKLLR